MTRLAMNMAQKNHMRQLKNNCGPKLTEEEHVSRLTALRRSFREIRELLIAKGAKTIDKLHPAIVEPDSPSLDDAEEGPFTFTSSFHVADKRDIVTEQYIKLHSQGTDDLSMGKNKEDPLHVSARDHRDFTPLALAVLRSDGHLVQLIMEIAGLHYSSRSDRKRYRIASSSDSYDSEMDYDSDSGLYTEIKVTPSRIHPITLLQTPNPFWRRLNDWAAYAKAAVGDYDENIEQRDIKTAFREPLRRIENKHEEPKRRNPHDALQYAIEQGHTDLANLLIDLGVKYSGVKPDTHGNSTSFSIEDSTFEAALRRGQIDVLSTMISRTGAGIPFKKLINHSGTEIRQKKPKYYQGLSVYGKKRHDWANRDLARFTGMELPDSPVLRAIFYGNLDTVRWFLSDEPLKKYLEYARTKADDAEAFGNAGGCEHVITSWWNTNRDLAIYCAVISKASPEEEIGRLELVLESMPELLNCQAWNGCTRLHLAFRLRKLSTAKYLIDRGAKQSLRDDEGTNILHEILCGDGDSKDSSADFFEAMLALIDPELVPTLTTQRMTMDSTTSILAVAVTPLAAWLEGDATLSPDRLRMILQKTGGAELRIMNGVGDYPLHTAIKVNSTELARALPEHNSEVLYWENAIGLTPVDLLDRAYQRDTLEFPTLLSQSIEGDVPPVYNSGSPDEHPPERIKFVQEIQGYCAALLGKRKLVSVLETNELVRRLEAHLAARAKKRAEQRQREKRRSEKLPKEHDKIAELLRLYCIAVSREDGEEADGEEAEEGGEDDVAM